MTASAGLTFDEYADAIQSAAVFYMKTGTTITDWDLAWYPVNRTTMQFGTDGSARIVHGVTNPDAQIFIMQRTKISGRVFLDGVLVPWNAIAIFPPGCHFTFVCDIPVEWVSVAVPTDLLNSRLLSADKYDGASLQTRKKMVTLSKASATQFVKAAQQLRVEIQKSAAVKSKYDEHAAERSLLAQLDEALWNHVSEKDLPTNLTESAEDIVFKALDYARSNQAKPIHIDELVDITGVEYRTLLRAFQRYLKIGPKRYLKLRQLNLVRRELWQRRRPKMSVIDILVDHGVNEFGRFATEYKKLYDETPSETLRR